MPADIALYGAYWKLPPALQTMEVKLRPRDVLTVSEDGRTAFLSSQGRVSTWDLVSGTPSGRIDACDGEAAAMTIRQRLLIVGTVEGAVLACDTAVGKRLWRLTAGPAPVSALAVSAAQPIIAAGDARGNVRVVDGTSGLEIESRRLHQTRVASLAFSPDGKRLLSASADAARLWTLGSSAKPAVLDPTGRHSATAFSGDGRVAIVATESELSFWDSATARRVGSLSLPRGGGRPVLSRDGRYVVAAIREGHMVSPLEQERLGAMEVLGVSFFAGSGRFGVSVDPLTSWTLPGYAGVHDAVFSADGETIVLAKKEGMLEVWSVARRAEPRSLTFGGPFRRPAFSSDGLLVLAPGRGDAALWDASNLNRLQVFRPGAVLVSSVAMVPSASTAAIGDGDGAITLWDTASGIQRLRIAAHRGEVSALAISPDGEELISVGADGVASIWGLADGGRRGQFADEKVQIAGASYSPRGGIAALWTQDGRLVWLETKPGGRREISSKQGIVYDAVFSPNGSQLLTAGHDGGIRLWTPFSQTPTVEAGSVKTRAGVAFLDKPGLAVVAGGWDRAIFIWDLVRAKELARFPALPEGPAVIARGSPTRTMTAGAYAQNLMWNFTAGGELLQFEPRLERARAALRKNPADAEGRNELGRWYAFRGRCEWASRMFESAGAVGEPGIHRFSCLAAAGRKEQALAELRGLGEAKTVSPLYETLWRRALQAPVDARQIN
jgi:WD40 repeat protein